MDTCAFSNCLQHLRHSLSRSGAVSTLFSHRSRPLLASGSPWRASLKKIITFGRSWLDCYAAVCGVRHGLSTARSTLVCSARCGPALLEKTPFAAPRAFSLRTHAAPISSNVQRLPVHVLDTQRYAANEAQASWASFLLPMVNH